MGFKLYHFWKKRDFFSFLKLPGKAAVKYVWADTVQPAGQCDNHEKNIFSASETTRSEEKTGWTNISA